MVIDPRTGTAIASLIAGGGFVLLWLAGPQGCAHVAAPPGGPPDSTAPVLVAVVPDSNSVVTDMGKELVRFEFEEPISERGVQGAVVVFPLDMRPTVEKGKRELRVRPRQGWIDGRIYHLRIGTTIQDLFQNRITEPIEYVISTGPPIPANRIEGSVIDRITGLPPRVARLDMVLVPDSLSPDTLRYAGAADSIGAVRLRALPEGDYWAIGYEDVNNNQRADDFDRTDTLAIAIGFADTLALEFQVFQHDTVGSILALVVVVDSTTLELGFDGYLDADIPVSIDQVEIIALADSASVTVDTVFHDWQYPAWRDSVQTVVQAVQDSLALEEALADSAAAEQAVPDSAAAEADSAAAEAIAAADETVARLAGLRAAIERRRGQAEQPADTGVVVQALPERRLFVILSAPLAPGSYEARATAIVNLSGLVGGGAWSFEVEAPESEESEEPPGPGPG